MPTSALPSSPAAARDGALEVLLAAIEARLADLAEATCTNDAVRIEAAATALHRALAHAVDHFARAATEGGVPPPLRRRFAAAGARVAVQRESLARATAALDRAMDALMPGMGTQPAAVYSAGGVGRDGPKGWTTA